MIIYQYVRADGALLACFVEGSWIVWPPGWPPVGDYYLACAVAR